MKQALVEVMLSYVKWFENTNSFALKANQNVLIPAPIKLFPDASLFNAWVTDAKKHIIGKKSIDRAKQRELYVAIDKNGRISSKPSCKQDHAVIENTRAAMFQTVSKLHIDEVRRASPPS